MVSVAYLQSASLYLSLIMGCLILFLSTLGNILTVLVFTNRTGTFRTSPCSLYFIAIAILNTLHMLHGLPHRILSGGFSIDITLTSLVVCKLRQYLVLSLPFMRNTLTCLATISQFFATSRQVHYRQKNTPKAARWYITVCIIFWFLHAIPYLFFYKIDIAPTTNKTRCDVFNKALSYYTTWIMYNVLTFIIPGSILIVFGYLTLQNVRCLGNDSNQSEVREQMERQMSLMLLVQVAFLLIGSMPAGVITLYMSITQASPKSSEQKAIESFVEAISFIIAYINCGNSFYVFYGTSTAFRKQCKKALQPFCCWTGRHQKDPTVPTTTQIQTDT